MGYEQSLYQTTPEPFSAQNEAEKEPLRAGFDLIIALLVEMVRLTKWSMGVAGLENRPQMAFIPDEYHQWLCTCRWAILWQLPTYWKNQTIQMDDRAYGSKYFINIAGRNHDRIDLQCSK